MADVPLVIRRPMPVQHVAVGRLAIPVPFDLAPHPRDRVANFALVGRVAVEILPRGEQALHQECSFHQVAAIVVLAKQRPDFAGVAIEKMGPDAVKAVRFVEKPHDLQHPRRRLVRA